MYGENLGGVQIGGKVTCGKYTLARALSICLPRDYFFVPINYIYYLFVYLPGLQNFAKTSATSSLLHLEKYLHGYTGAAPHCITSSITHAPHLMVNQWWKELDSMDSDNACTVPRKYLMQASRCCGLSLYQALHTPARTPTYRCRDTPSGVREYRSTTERCTGALLYQGPPLEMPLVFRSFGLSQF